MYLCYSMWDRPKIRVLFDVIWATINTCWSYKWEFHHSAKGNDWESDTPLSLSFFSMSGFSPTQLAMLVIAWMQVVAGSAPSCRRLALNGWDKACNKWTHFFGHELRQPMSRNEEHIRPAFCSSAALSVLPLQGLPPHHQKPIQAVQQSGNVMVGFCLNWKGFGIPKSFLNNHRNLVFGIANRLAHWPDFGQKSSRISSLLSLLPSCGHSGLWLSLWLWPSSRGPSCCRGYISPHNCSMERGGGRGLPWIVWERPYDLSWIRQLDIS